MGEGLKRAFAAAKATRMPKVSDEIRKIITAASEAQSAAVEEMRSKCEAIALSFVQYECACQRCQTAKDITRRIAALKEGNA